MKITKGHEKMLLYLNRLIRTDEFKDILKEYIETCGNMNKPEESWSKETREYWDVTEKEINKIFKSHKALQKRCSKLFQGKVFQLEREIAENYDLDHALLHYAISMLEKNESALEYLEYEADMCRITDLQDEEISPLDPGEENIHLNLARQFRHISYPIAIQIHNKASKEDIIDFISKKWPFIDQLREDRGPRLRKSKRPWEVVDFIWEHRDLPAPTIRKMLRVKFEDYSITYNEILDVIRMEKRRRAGTLSE